LVPERTRGQLKSGSSLRFLFCPYKFFAYKLVISNASPARCTIAASRSGKLATKEV
jgi:hypothetical protein